MPKSPEDWLRQVSPPEKTRGILKLFLGYAPGVGKTYSMLSEAIRRHSRGEDVVIGFVETHGRKPIAELASRVENVPRRRLEYKGALFEEMDVDAILARHPQVVVVDELAHSNIVGSKHRKRYEDVLELLGAGIDVLTTINIQHLDSVAPLVRSITGITVRETIPDWVLQTAAETVMVDLTPEALRNRMLRGDVYSLDKADQALRNFFRVGNLIALRELALRQVAEQVDRTLESFLVTKNIQENWPVRERIAVCISANPTAQYLIARSVRMARRLKADLMVVHVDTGDDASGEAQKSLANNIHLAENLGASFVQLRGTSVAEVVAEFVRDRRISQVVFGRSTNQGWRKFSYIFSLDRFLSHAPPVDVHIVTQHPDG